MPTPARRQHYRQLIASAAGRLSGYLPTRPTLRLLPWRMPGGSRAPEARETCGNTAERRPA